MVDKSIENELKLLTDDPQYLPDDIKKTLSDVYEAFAFNGVLHEGEYYVRGYSISFGTDYSHELKLETEKWDIDVSIEFTQGGEPLGKVVNKQRIQRGPQLELWPPWVDYEVPHLKG